MLYDDIYFLRYRIGRKQITIRHIFILYDGYIFTDYAGPPRQGHRQRARYIYIYIYISICIYVCIYIYIYMYT